MNSNQPASLAFSLEGFVRRGGQTDKHRDGWGIAYFEGQHCRVLRDEQPSCQSQLAERMRHHPVKSRTVIAHIRKATQGRVALSNCHPFTRRLWGRDWVFAHNGDLKKLALKLDGRYRPQGSTDSELAFCYMLQELQRRCGPARPALAVLLAEIAQLNAELSCHGPFNYLLADGQDLFAHCSTSLHHVARAHPFRAVRLLDHDLGVDLAQLNRADERMTVITTRPLTSGEDWVAFRPGELKHFRDGLEASLRPVSAPLQPA